MWSVWQRAVGRISVVRNAILQVLRQASSGGNSEEFGSQSHVTCIRYPKPYLLVRIFTTSPIIVHRL